MIGGKNTMWLRGLWVMEPDYNSVPEAKRLVNLENGNRIYIRKMWSRVNTDSSFKFQVVWENVDGKTVLLHAFNTYVAAEEALEFYRRLTGAISSLGFCSVPDSEPEPSDVSNVS